MRRKDREVSIIEDIISIINECKVMRIGITDEDGMYIVPLNFGYEYSNGVFYFYIHSANEGRKVEALQSNPGVAIQMDCGHKLVEGEKPESFSYRYRSISGSGTADLLTDINEAKKGLNCLLKHQTGRRFSIGDEAAVSANVYRITVKALTGKQNI